MKFIMVMTLFLISSSGSAASQKLDVADPLFPFEEDRKVLTGDTDFSVIKNSGDLKNDPFLQKPMTHLEYVVDRLDRQLNKESNINSILKKYGKFFKPNIAHGKNFDLEIKGDAIYIPKNGKILLSYAIEYAGPSMVPLKELCEKLIDEIFYSISPGSELGSLIYDQNSAPKLEKKIKSNMAYMVSIHTSSDDYKVHHHLTCLQGSDIGQLVFNKFSQSIPSEPIPTLTTKLKPESEIEKIVSLGAKTYKESGMAGLISLSEDMYKALGNNPMPDDLEKCVAIDMFSNMLDSGMTTKLKLPKQDYFNTINFQKRISPYIKKMGNSRDEVNNYLKKREQEVRKFFAISMIEAK